jgi:hypothetical protein
MSAIERTPIVDVATLVERSLVIGSFSRILDRIHAVALQAHVVGVARAWRQQLDALPRRDRIRLGGLSLISFSATYFALMLIVPARAAPAYPSLFWVSAAIPGLICVGGAGTLATAWRARRG